MSPSEIVAELFQTVEDLRNLEWEAKERIANILIERVWLLGTKLKQSPYQSTPYNDPLGLRVGLAGALQKWVRQFPANCQAGAIALAISVCYITQRERDSFVEVCVDTLQERYTSNRPGDERQMLPIPLTEGTDVYGSIAHQLGTHRRATRRIEGSLISILRQAAQTLYNLSNKQMVDEYFPLGSILPALINTHWLVVEDWSLSGASVITNIKYVLRLFEAVFHSKVVGSVLRGKGHLTPKLTIVLPFATKSAIDRIKDALNREVLGILVDADVLAGFVFEQNNRLGSDHIPAWLMVLESKVPSVSISWRKQALAACEFVANQEGALKHEWSAEWLQLGYCQDGLPIVGFSNCPDNSLPLYWRTDAGTYQPLFPRSPSSTAVLSTEGIDLLGEQLKGAKQDSEGLLQNAVAKFLSNY